MCNQFSLSPPKYGRIRTSVVVLAAMVAGTATTWAGGKDAAVTNGDYRIEDVERTVLAAKPQRFFGRSVLVDLPGDPRTWLLFYHEASHHWECRDGVMHVRFSRDYGESWSGEDRHLDGSRVAGFPAWPPGAEPEAIDYPGEPWAYVAPNGDVVLHTLNRRSAPPAFNGTWQLRSNDGGRTWSEWSRIEFQGVREVRAIAAIEDHVVVGNAIYQSAKNVSNHAGPKIQPVRNILVRSTDNGATWQKLSNITTHAENTNECGIEHLGGKTLIAVIVDLTYKSNIQSYSHDLGETWTDRSRLAFGSGETVMSMHRPRLNTATHIRGEANWWEDPLLIVATNANVFHGSGPRQRRNAVWVSPDRGRSWQQPLWLDEETEDAGYGNMAWDPVKERYVAILYHGRRDEAELVQYKFRLVGPE